MPDTHARFSPSAANRRIHCPPSLLLEEQFEEGESVYAAEGKLRPQDIPRILADGRRTAAGPTVPAAGLAMTQLWYDDGEVAFHVE